MKKFLTIPLMISIICLTPIFTWAQSQTAVKKPLLLVFTGVISSQYNTPEKPSKKKSKKKEKVNVPSLSVDSLPVFVSDPQVAEEVMSQISTTGKMEVLPYNPDHAAIQRAVLEKKIQKEMLDKPTDEASMLKISSAIGADYVLRIQGTADAFKVDLVLEMIKLKVKDPVKWLASAASTIPEGSGPRASVNRKNAIFNAVGSAVSQIMILAFGQNEMLNSPSPALPSDKPDTVPVPDVTVPRDIKAEVDTQINKAAELLGKNNIPGAIVELRRAINIDPSRTDIRLGLAELYSKMGNTRDAIDECQRALLFNKKDLSIYNELAKLYMNIGDLNEAAKYTNEVVKLDVNNIDARLNLGDLYWNQSKIDDAEKTYLEAMNISPSNPAPHIRLQKLYSAKHNSKLAINHMFQAKLLTAGQLDENGRYKVVSKFIQDEFLLIISKIDTGKADFEKNVISRDDYYQECREFAAEVDILADLFAGEKVPAEYKDAHPHGLLGISLLSQACESLVSYFETEKRHYIDQVDVFKSEAKNEMKLFAKSTTAN